jgi:hypothetical protein
MTKSRKSRDLVSRRGKEEIEDCILAKHYNLEREFEKAGKELKEGGTKSREFLLSNSE